MSANQPQAEDANSLGALWAERYRIKSRLGDGGMGRVFLAIDEHLQAQVVIKTPLPELMKDCDFLTRFDREVLSMVRLRHHGIVAVLDYMPQHHPPFFVLEYMQQGSLAKRPKPPGGPLAALWWLTPIARTLDYVHAQHHAHRDIKPSNILIDHCGEARLGDFGIVKPLDATTELTNRGSLLGSLPYMGPEALTPEHFENIGVQQRWFRSDQHALAVTVYEVLSEQHPFTIATRLNPKYEPKPIHVVCPGFPEGLSPALARGFAYQPEERYASCEEFARAVLTAAAVPVARPGSRVAPTASNLGITLRPDGVVPGPHAGLSDAGTQPATGSESAPLAGKQARKDGSRTIPLLPGKSAATSPPAWSVKAFLTGALCAFLLSALLVVLLLPFLPRSEGPAPKSDNVAKDKTDSGKKDILKGEELVVSPKGPHQTLAAALAVAKPADRIVIRAGEYREGQLALRSGVQIIGAGKETVTVTISAPVTVSADVRLRGVTLRAQGSLNGALLRVSGGSPRFEDCDLEGGEQKMVVRVSGGTPLFKGCRLKKAADGVVADETGKARFEECEIFGQSKRALVVQKGATLTLQGCKPIWGTENGLEVNAGGHAELVDCDVLGAKTGANVDVARGGVLVLRKCRVSGAAEEGIATEGQTTLEDSDLIDNNTGIKVAGGNLRVRGGKILGGKVGLFVPRQGEPSSIIVLGCAVKGARAALVQVFAGREVVFHKCQFEDAGEKDLVSLAYAASASFTGCTFNRANGHLLALWEGGAASLSGCELTLAKGAGVWVKDETTTVVLNDCTVKDNAIGVKGEGGAVLVVRNTNLQQNTRPSETTPEVRLLTLPKTRE